HFIRALSNHVVRVEAGQLRHFPGGYQYYLDKTSQSARAALTSSSQATPSRVSALKQPSPGIDRKEQKRLEAEQRQARSRKRQEIQKRISALEKEIAELETREKQLTAELEKPETYATPGEANRINRQLLEIHDRLPEATAQWEAAAADLETA
ncbi:MAG TPA: ABC transporter ATP-binding protein, partial [Verrucomicrobiota bacterium]|nr:ABC transporter ATP-binding protein [Verrucomicrobiota bacterium]